MVGELMEEFEAAAQKALDAMSRDFARIRTGRANLALLDGVKVDYYGAATPLNQVASLQVADARMIIIKPWEKKVIPDIERAIGAANLGVTPQNDGEVVRLSIPPLTEERRRDLTRQTKSRAEEARVAIRNERRGVNEMLKELQKEGELPEDDMHKALKSVQDRTDAFVKKVDAIVETKDKEIMEV